MLRLAFVAACVAAIAYFFVVSFRWPLLEDSAIMHYVVFLTRHGFEPYQTITDNNLPGAYLTEGWAMRVFGGGDVAWRVYDFTLLTSLIALATAITRRRDWFAGFFGGAFFVLLHASDGPRYAVERDEIISILLLLSCALLFWAVHRHRPVLLLLFGFAIGMAASIKPTALPFGIVFLVVGCVSIRREQRPLGPYIGFPLAGFAFAGILNVAFLLEHHALGPFWFVTHNITPHYVALAHPSFADMLRNLLPRDVRNFVLLVGLPLFMLNRGVRGWTWEHWALALGAIFGLASFWIQQKGFVQHRYPFEVFLLLLLGLEISRGFRTPGWPRYMACFAVLVALIWFLPTLTRSVHRQPTADPLTSSLQADLVSLGGGQLQNKVFCFDLVFGCLNTLYHMQLVENTGFTGDLLLFFPVEGGPAATFYRQKFMQSQSDNPATVLVMTNQWLQRPNSYAKIDTWPAFVTWLNANYTLVVTRSFPTDPTAPPLPQSPGYRIYLRKGSPFGQPAQFAEGSSR